jgi:hypothetical protein
MKIFLVNILIWLSCITTLNGQTLSASDLFMRGEYSDQVGFLPKSLESLVGSASIIVKGKFNQKLSNDKFFGYEDNRESFKQKHDLTETQVDRMAIPRSDYKIKIDEVLLGDITSDSITYRIFENPPTDRKYTEPDVDRLFFLYRNPDGTYTPLGPASVLNVREGKYSYDALASFRGSYENQDLMFLNDVDAESFLNEVRLEINKQYPEK